MERVCGQSLVVKALLPAEKIDGGRVRENTQIEGVAPVVDQIRAGLPIEEFFALQDLLKVSEDELARVLGISIATLHRRKKSGRLDARESERVVRFACLFGRAMEVFETEKAARGWLRTEAPGLAGETPLTYADTEYGAREVEALLVRIDHGVF